MSHHIDKHGEQAAAIFARTDPWHRLGVTVAGRAFTAQEAMTLGRLGGWDVRKVPLTAHELTSDGVTALDVPGYATVRTNPFTGHPQALGVVGGGYQPIQNEEHCEFLNHLADASGAVFDTAGSLRGGRQVFVTMTMPEHLLVGGTDRLDLNIAALNSHDGSSAFRLLLTPVRVVCANTQAAALRNHAATVSIRHTRGARSAVTAARDALGLTFAYAAEFQTQADQLIEQDLTDAAFADLVRATFPTPPRDSPGRARDLARRRWQTLSQLFHDADTQDGIRGTAWAGYQAVVEYVDHYAPVRTTTSDVATARATRLLTSATPTRIKHTAWATLTGTHPPNR